MKGNRWVVLMCKEDCMMIWASDSYSTVSHRTTRTKYILTSPVLGNETMIHTDRRTLDELKHFFITAGAWYEVPNTCPVPMRPCAGCDGVVYVWSDHYLCDGCLTEDTDHAKLPA